MSSVMSIPRSTVANQVNYHNCAPLILDCESPSLSIFTMNFVAPVEGVDEAYSTRVRIS